MKTQSFKSWLARQIACGAGRVLQRFMHKDLPASYYEWRNVRCSYSQLGEDILILEALGEAVKTKSYYVDAGAYDPVYCSNTLSLRKMGWRGINIDPQPKHITAFEKQRPDDTNLQLAVGCIEGEAAFLQYSHGTTGRLANSPEDREKSALGEDVKQVMSVEVRSLGSILNEHAPVGIPFGFLNIDCEGGDLGVLKSNIWEKYRPLVIAVEDPGIGETEIVKFLNSYEYSLYSIASVTKIFINKKK